MRQFEDEGKMLKNGGTELLLQNHGLSLCLIDTLKIAKLSSRTISKAGETGFFRILQIYLSMEI